MADGGHDRHATPGDGAHDLLVAERQEILEAPSAAGDDDDVDVRMGGESVERRHDRLGSSLPLDACFADHDPRGSKALPDRRQEVSAGGSVCPGEGPDRARQTWQRTLPLPSEEALACKPALQPFEREEMLAEADPLDRRGAQSELAPRLIQLGAALDVNGLAFLQAEIEPVVGPAADGCLERRAGARVLRA